MAANGTPQSYLNSLRPQSNSQVNNIRDRSMEQDNTNSGNPYGYMPQLPGQQIPDQYPTNRYIPPEWSNDGSPYGKWSTQGLTYSLPTAYNPYGQGGTPYGPSMPQFSNPMHPGTSNPPYAQVQPNQPSGQPQTPSTDSLYRHPSPGYVQPSTAAAASGTKPSPVGATLPSNAGGITPLPPQAAGNNVPPNNQRIHGSFRDNRQPAGDFWRGIVPQFNNQGNSTIGNQYLQQAQQLAAQLASSSKGSTQVAGAPGIGNSANNVGVPPSSGGLSSGAYTGGFGSVGTLGSFGSYMPAISLMGQTPNGY